MMKATHKQNGRKSYKKNDVRVSQRFYIENCLLDVMKLKFTKSDKKTVLANTLESICDNIH